MEALIDNLASLLLFLKPFFTVILFLNSLFLVLLVLVQLPKKEAGLGTALAEEPLMRSLGRGQEMS